MKVTANACGWVTNNVLECPREPACPNSIINDDDIKAKRLQLFSLSPGKACIFKISNNLSDADKVAIWKVSASNTNSSLQINTLTSITTTDLKSLGKGEWDAY